MGVNNVVVKKFTFAISSPDEFLFIVGVDEDQGWRSRIRGA